MTASWEVRHSSATPASLAPGANVAVTVRMRGTTSVSRIVTVT